MPGNTIVDINPWKAGCDQTFKSLMLSYSTTNYLRVDIIGSLNGLKEVSRRVPYPQKDSWQLHLQTSITEYLLGNYNLEKFHILQSGNNAKHEISLYLYNVNHPRIIAILDGV